MGHVDVFWSKRQAMLFQNGCVLQRQSHGAVNVLIYIKAIFDPHVCCRLTYKLIHPYSACAADSVRVAATFHGSNG